MKKLIPILIVAALFFSVASKSLAYTSVRGYYRNNGTYVQPYVRSSPNVYKSDNYGYSGGSVYNKSYYAPTRNYSSNWYTPSYYTDSNYYYGKSLYNSRSYYGY